MSKLKLGGSLTCPTSLLVSGKTTVWIHICLAAKPLFTYGHKNIITKGHLAGSVGRSLASLMPVSKVVWLVITSQAATRMREKMHGKWLHLWRDDPELHTSLQLSSHWLKCSPQWYRTAKKSGNACRLQLGSQSSTHLKLRSSVIREKSKRVDSGDKPLPLPPSVSSLVISLISTEAIEVLSTNLKCSMPAILKW